MDARAPTVFCFSLISILVLVSCDIEDRKGRKPRLFSFNNEDGDISVNLEFSIPFLKIPTQKTADTAFGLFSSGLPTININPGALALGGAVVLGTTILVPFFLKTYAMHFTDNRYSRVLDNEFSTESVLQFASKFFTDGSSVHGCALRVACWAAQRATTDPLITWSNLMSNTLLSNMVNASAIEEAMLAGRKGRDCVTYKPCPLEETHIPMVMSNLATFAHSIG